MAATARYIRPPASDKSEYQRVMEGFLRIYEEFLVSWSQPYRILSTTSSILEVQYRRRTRLVALLQRACRLYCAPKVFADVYVLLYAYIMLIFPIQIECLLRERWNVCWRSIQPRHESTECMQRSIVNVTLICCKTTPHTIFNTDSGTNTSSHSNQHSCCLSIGQTMSQVLFEQRVCTISIIPYQLINFLFRRCMHSGDISLH